MWCGFAKSGVNFATACLLAVGVITYNISDTTAQNRTGNPVRQKSYTSQEFRSVLRGLGYKIKVSSDPLNDAEAKKAVREFQTGYKLKPVDGIAGPQTQDYAAGIVRILNSNLNVVMKPKSALPRSKFYSDQTEAMVKEFQKKFQLSETGIADLAVRQKLDQEAKSAVGSKPAPATKPSTSTKPSNKPKVKPTPTATPTPVTTITPAPEATPTPEETSTPEATPTPEETSTPEATPTPTPTKPATKK
jgi:peptidoglycan hydrolase-like protein with peptidoglycan-binding domain